MIRISRVETASATFDVDHFLYMCIQYSKTTIQQGVLKCIFILNSTVFQQRRSHEVFSDFGAVTTPLGDSGRVAHHSSSHLEVFLHRCSIFRIPNQPDWWNCLSFTIAAMVTSVPTSTE